MIIQGAKYTVHEINPKGQLISNGIHSWEVFHSLLGRGQHSRLRLCKLVMSAHTYHPIWVLVFTNMCWHHESK